MSREHLTAQIRRIRNAEQRSPVENAFYALQSLTNAQQVELVERHNRLHNGRAYPHVYLDAKLTEAAA